MATAWDHPLQETHEQHEVFREMPLAPGVIVSGRIIGRKRPTMCRAFSLVTHSSKAYTRTGGEAEQRVYYRYVPLVIRMET